MKDSESLSKFLVDHWASLRFLVLNPAKLFAVAEPPNDYRLILIMALPPVLIFAIGIAVLKGNPWLALLGLVGAYAGIGIWSLALKYVLIFFGEKRPFTEILYLAVCAALSLAVAWVPIVGPPVCFLLIAFWTFMGLVHRFKMNSGAAVAAVALPVVITGLGGGILSYLLILLASLTTMFR